MAESQQFSELRMQSVIKRAKKVALAYVREEIAEFTKKMVDEAVAKAMVEAQTVINTMTKEMGMSDRFSSENQFSIVIKLNE